MSKKTVITCDHCGKEIPNNCDERFSHMGCNAAFAMGTIDACSREHLGLALAKAFGLPIDAKAADLFVEHAKSEARRLRLEAEVNGLERDHRHCVEAVLESAIVPPGRTLAEGIGELVRLHRHAAKKIVELEKRIAELTAPVTIDGKTPVDLDNLAGRLVSVFEAAYHTGPNDQLASVRAGIRAVLAALPMPIMQPVSVDGKTPGQVALEAWNPDANGHSIYRDDWERAALAVLRAFGQPRQTTQDAAEALRRVRDRVSNEIHYEHKCLILDIVDDELAKLEAMPVGKAPECFLCGKGPHDHTMMVLESLPEQFEVKWCNGRRQNFGTEKPAWWNVPKSDHVHEIGSCSFCDKQPPNTSAESGLPDAVLAAITLPTKPTKPLRERLEELAAYWYMGDKDDKELNGAYRLARRECAKELREVINDPR